MNYVCGKNLKNEWDINALRKGLCPWCLEKLCPIFVDEKHDADKCPECGDTFK